MRPTFIVGAISMVGIVRPSLESLIGLAVAFGHGCTASDLIDAIDVEHSSAAERRDIEFVRSGVSHAISDT